MPKLLRMPYANTFEIRRRRRRPSLRRRRRTGCPRGVVPSSFSRRIDAGEVRVVGLGSAELVVRRSPAPNGPSMQVLHLAAAAVVADEDVELAVGAEEDHAAVVVAAQRLAGVGLERAQRDDRAVERQRRAVPLEAVDAIAEQRHVGEASLSAPVLLSVQKGRRTGSCWKPRVQGDAEQAALRRRVDRQVEHGRRDGAVDDPLDPAAALLEHEEVVRPRNATPIGWASPPTTERTSRSGSLTVGAGVCAAACPANPIAPTSAAGTATRAIACSSDPSVPP